MDKDNLQSISDAIKDIISTNFTFDTYCINVPHYDDSGLTFESGETKKGKMIKTCVLFVDIRNSVALNKKYNVEAMGQLYTSFVKSALWCANYHHGLVRNIIGDRVMIVFPPKNCFTNAIECAISINTISSKIIRRYCDDFKCGIGIDYGEMYVHKTGIIKQGKEASSYKNLIWIGRPANIASRLTDIANKELSETIFRVTRKLKNPRAYRHKDQGYTYLPSSLLGPLERVHNEPLYLDKEETVEMSIEEFSNSIWQSESTGEITTLNGKMVHFEKDIRNFSQKPILMTQSVYNGFMNETPNHSTISKKYWQEVKADIRDYEGKVWGGDIVWSSVKDINS